MVAIQVYRHSLRSVGKRRSTSGADADRAADADNAGANNAGAKNAGADSATPYSQKREQRCAVPALCRALARRWHPRVWRLRR